MDIDDDAGEAAAPAPHHSPGPARPVAAQLRTTVHADRTAVHVVGDVDISTVGSLRDVLATAIAAHRTDIVVVLTETTFLDAAGLGVLVAAHNRAVGQGGRVQLVLHQDMFLRSLRITGLDRVFALHRTLGSALGA